MRQTFEIEQEKNPTLIDLKWHLRLDQTETANQDYVVDCGILRRIQLAWVSSQMFTVFYLNQTLGVKQKCNKEAGVDLSFFKTMVQIQD